MNHLWENHSAKAGVAGAPGAENVEMHGSPLLEKFVQRRDEAAFAELIRVHGPLVYGVCRRVIGNHHDAEDAFQATFLILSQKAKAVKNSEVLPSWLYRVAFHVSLRAKAALNKRRVKETPMTAAHQPVAVPQTVWLDLEPMLDQELNRLSEKYRAPIVLCDIGGSTLKDAAKALGWSPGTLATRLAKARSLLAERLARQGVTLSAGALAILMSQHAASAAVPSALAMSTLQTAGVLSVGQTVSVGTASSKAVALAQGTLKSMLFANLKIAAAGLLVIAAAGLALQIPREEPPQAPVVAQPADNTVHTGLAAEIQQALQDNAAQLTPITISYTEQLQSRLSEQETFERLTIANSRSYQHLLQEHPSRVILQDQNFYTFEKGIYGTYNEDTGYRAMVQQRESSFNGSVRCFGFVNERPFPGNLIKVAESSRSASEGNSAPDCFGSSFFEGFVGLGFPPRGPLRAAGLRAESVILGSLERGGELLSVTNVSIEDRPHVRIELRVENEEKTWADQADLENMKQMYNGGLYTPEDRERFLNDIVENRKLPKTKRVVYFLDPALHYAVRQKEEWYDPGTLLLRSTCSDFQQLPHRQLWLPQRYVIVYSTFRTAQGVVFADPFLSQVVQVTELSGARVPDSQFVLEYTQPGTFVMEFPGPDPQDKSSPPQPLNYGYTVGQTPSETQKNKEIAEQTARAKMGGAGNAITISGGSAQPPMNGPKSNSRVRWFLIANSAVILFIGGYFAYRQFVR